MTRKGVMDDSVRAAMAKWPNVPDVFGWLRLDGRGQWWIQNQRLSHPAMIEFIQRNYAQDRQGRAFFQNGPQRVYVELEATPFIWRVGHDFSVRDHMGRSARVKHCLMDEQGHVYFETDRGFGLVHTSDMNDVANAIDQGVWTPEWSERAGFELHYGYCKSPEANQKR